MVEDKNKAEQLKKAKEVHDSNPLNKIADGRVQKHIEYYDMDDNKHVLDATLQEPSALLVTQLNDMIAKGDGIVDYGAVFEILMEKIIVSPNLNYEQMNKDLAKKYQNKIFRFTNKVGKKIKVNFKFPDYRSAFNIVLGASKSNGDSNNVNTIKALNKYVIEDSNGESIDFDFYNRGHDGFGMIKELPDQALAFLERTLDKDGYLSLLYKTFQYANTAITNN
ncbi:hypothetical protein DY120_07455 [Apilactobacillus micheneri]|uniref:Uncharacterized protein n=1 Tax=Apilactobacillus micheneri TaxID=1899430 RepID=A0ABY2YW22_9LACO|nr:hypothetical protein [Apilactobacillus micheneri]TPR23134.1 hypothetical protein DY114_07440 [Apilactobacillus micheneri]TPR24452.1 hypothetical protein DY111_07455 [Apilactobacillus micheneri]TPR29399.1 hypothetical protein DY120_07455 [Apilactobacillus micheneri]TPR34606.1 hypothetical protein DY027_07445 [Apilactobacillus micheneri]